MKTLFKNIAHLYLGCRIMVTGESIQRLMLSISDGGILGVEYNGIGVEEIDVSDVTPILRPLSDISQDEAYKLVFLCMDDRYHLEPDSYMTEEEISIGDIVPNDGGLMLDDDCVLYIQVSVRCWEGAVIIRKDGSICNENEGDQMNPKREPVANNAQVIAYLISRGFDMFNLIENGEAISSNPE